MTKELDKAFYWKCCICGYPLRDNQDIVFIQEGIMSGNTPVFHGSKAHHRKCMYEDHGDE